MNKLLTNILALACILVCTLLFSGCESESDSLKYTVTDEDALTVEVSDYTGFGGSLSIPARVTIEGRQGEYSVTGIGSGAFSGHTNLTDVTIPETVTNISVYAFRGCTSLTAINVDGNNPNYSSANGIVYSKDMTELILCPTGLTSVVIPMSTTSIGSRAFSGCTNLTKIMIPKSVKNIESGAFTGAAGLTSITCLSATPLPIKTSTFVSIPKSKVTVYVPQGSEEAYKNADVWGDFNIVENND